MVTEVYHEVQPGYLVTSTASARYFLEVNAGELENVAVGDQVAVELLASESPVEASDWVTPMGILYRLPFHGLFCGRDSGESYQVDGQ